MTKTVNGSFIVDCDVDSERHDDLNQRYPYYEISCGKRIYVCVIQTEYVLYKNGLRVIYELVEV